ncbi:MAG: hypothetical protein QF817_00480, partial [Candidatus Poseidoniaceae archaeon]|nr:hypothetical protein [Candidatus Poseidoniaceae archaeon]
EASSYLTITIDENDQVATLQTDAPNDEHIIHVTIEASEDSLINLQEESVTVTFRIWAISNTIEDAQSADIEVTLHRLEVKSEGASSSEGDGSFLNIIQWILGSLIVLVLLGFLIREIIATDEEEDEYGVYETSASAIYGDVKSAPDMSSFGSSPSSGMMPLGPAPSLAGLPAGAPPEPSKELIGIAPSDPQIIHEPEVVHETPAVAEPAAPEVAAPPAVPAEGLPAGWTMEQWNHYGAEWLKQQGRV